MQTPLRGVNLGGWLVLEKWMTPSLFIDTPAKNEFELAKTPDGARKIKQHHETFITEADFRYLSQAGIQGVRLPVGFWVLEGYYSYVSAKGRLDWVFEMTKKYDLQILLCLHAAPGPQNSNDHSGSGQPGKTGWYSRTHRHMTQQVLCEFAYRYGRHPQLWGIELMNEPEVKSVYQAMQMLRWVRCTTRILRNILPSNVRIVVSDCYQPRFWSGKIGAATLDIHHYQCFSQQDNERASYAEHRSVLEYSAKRYASYQKRQPIVLGEWSATLPKSVRSDSAAGEFLVDQWNTVLPVADAWFFWSYKTEHGGSWSFRWLHERGYFDTLM